MSWGMWLVDKLQQISISSQIFVAGLIRVLLMFYGQHQDVNMDVKYTDIDYTVFTDAARHVYYGNSPYNRHTYRYSPLLAYLMVPNIMVHELAGKIVFILLDLLSGLVIFNIMRDSNPAKEPIARLCSFIWLFNPLVITISTRGSAESLVVSLVLLTLFFYHQKLFVLSGMMYGIAIHMKIYPIIYCLALYTPLTNWTGIKSLFQVTQPRIRLVCGTLLTLITLNWVFYHLYGEEFLQETYLYHVTRKDIRHNFSVYFYMLYLTVEFEDIGLSVLAFLPQLLLILAIGYRFNNIYEVNFCLFCQTLIFVTFNKVVTAQYFVWYFSLLPLVVPLLNLSTKEIFIGTCLWGFAQSSWLLPAYLLEFKGINTFMFLWLESLAFFCANVGILAKIIRKYREIFSTIESQCDIHKLD